MKSAKEMFEELGYELIDKDEYFITYKKRAVVDYEIVFCIYEKCIEIMPTIDGKSHYFVRLEKNLLQAINQQAKELGEEK